MATEGTIKTCEQGHCTRTTRIGNLEVIKDWLWVSGKTFDVRDALKELGFRYSPDKKRWYWRADEKKITIAHEPLPFNLIREKYGSKEVILL